MKVEVVKMRDDGTSKLFRTVLLDTRVDTVYRFDPIGGYLFRDEYDVDGDLIDTVLEWERG